ncbi:hypothetical protein [Nevskia sp.]|uniref:hypothetical protein n=1 Tax=Nevskia sp. TaxID=1929292 RepID=UPI0025D4F279|nr:hypothetical protein [Nevskia sp.]
MKFIPIFPELLRKGGWEFDQLTDRAGTLVLMLVDAGNRRARLSFDSYFAYRKLDEGDALLTLVEIGKTGGTGRYFYRVEDSTFLAWFNQERCAVSSSTPLIHYAIAASNDIIDVLAMDAPRVDVE